MLGAPFFLDVCTEGVVGYDAVNVADFTFLDHGADLNGEGEETRPNRLHQEQFLLLSRLDQLSGLRRVRREGFFADNVFPSEEAEHRVLVMVGVRGGDVDDVYLRIVHYLCV